MDAQEIETRFTYHSPTADQPAIYVRIRELGRHFAEILCEVCPESRELSLALTNLEQSIFWANAAVARRSKSEAVAPLPK